MIDPTARLIPRDQHRGQEGGDGGADGAVFRCQPHRGADAPGRRGVGRLCEWNSVPARKNQTLFLDQAPGTSHLPVAEPGRSGGRGEFSGTVGACPYGPKHIPPPSGSARGIPRTLGG